MCDRDTGKIVRLWLGSEAAAAGEVPSLAVLSAAQKALAPTDELSVPQITVPTGFAMAEMSGMAGVTTVDNTKAGFQHRSMVPTGIVSPSR